MYEDLQKAYAQSDLPSIVLGGIVVSDKLLPSSDVHLLLKQFNRHGLIAGATGTGKTKTLQVLCEQLALQGVPSLVMDIKGDISGLGMPGVSNFALEERSQLLHIPFEARPFTIEMLSLSAHIKGVPLRASVQDFGALLFSRMLGLNDTQSGVLTLLFEYAKNNKMPLIDLNDLKALLKFSQTEEGKANIEKQYGLVSSASVSTIMRNIIELEAQEGDVFFGEPAFDIHDLLRKDHEGQGVISILRLMDMQDKPQLFSTFMLKLLSDIYRELPELGDPPKPELVIFIDEAHLIFDHASKALLNLLDTMVKLIRSKGVGLIFCTQTPDDIPENILSQLGLKIQHALRAFTAKDRKAMKLAAQNFPVTSYYQTESLLTSLGIGEALLSALDRKGTPTPLIQCKLRPPQSRMGTLTAIEEERLLNQSILYPKYAKRSERLSLSELLPSREVPEVVYKSQTKIKESGMFEQLSKNTLVRQVVRDLFKKIVQVVVSALKSK